MGSLSGQLKLFLITTRQTSDHNTEQNSDHNTEQTSDHNTEQTSDHDIPVVKKRRKAKVGTTHQDSCTKDREETIAEDPVEEDREETTGPSHKDTSSEFSVTEVCPLWSERDKVTITHLCWSTEVSGKTEGVSSQTGNVSSQTESVSSQTECQQLD